MLPRTCHQLEGPCRWLQGMGARRAAMPITGSLRSLDSESPREPQRATVADSRWPDSQAAGSRKKKREKRPTVTHRIGYHELSRRTVASEGCQPVDFVREPHRFESKPGVAKRDHERFIQQHPGTIPLSRRLRFSGRRGDCV